MAIILENVVKTYKDGDVETKALKGISLRIEDGEFIVILGPSGSGKSTMLNVISGLDTVTSGRITYNGENLSSYSEDKMTMFRRKHLSFIFQQYNLIQNLTVNENIQLGADIGSDPLEVDEVLKKVGLYGEKDKYPYQLSGGEQQRVSVARSIAKNPEIIFCDEPTGSLDEQNSKQVLEVIQKLNDEYGTTTVMITHNPGIADMADRVIRMNSGLIEEIKTNLVKKRAQEIHWG